MGRPLSMMCGARGRRLSTATLHATRLVVSERMAYRDFADTMAQGVPIEGEAGVGYRMQSAFNLPRRLLRRSFQTSPMSRVLDPAKTRWTWTSDNL